MLSLQTVVLLALMAGLVWLWSDSRGAAERAAEVCRSTCRDLNLQFLDQALALSGLGIARNTDGRLKFLRQFRFEFSTTGADRRQGRVTMLGARVESVLLDQPDGSILIVPPQDGVHRLN